MNKKMNTFLSKIQTLDMQTEGKWRDNTGNLC